MSGFPSPHQWSQKSRSRNISQNPSRSQYSLQGRSCLHTCAGDRARLCPLQRRLHLPVKGTRYFYTFHFRLSCCHWHQHSFSCQTYMLIRNRQPVLLAILEGKKRYLHVVMDICHCPFFHGSWTAPSQSAFALEKSHGNDLGRDGEEWEWRVLWPAVHVGNRHCPEHCHSQSSKKPPLWQCSVPLLTMGSLEMMSWE